MGIHGIYKEIGPGERIALSKLAIDKFEETGRPLRLAIDISIWLFQIQEGTGGNNPAHRTFYYRLIRLMSLSIHPLFVFDGPNKPPFKRNKRTGSNIASMPDFLAKQLLKQFGFPYHTAPGEAEAECALLQREGIVDAVLSEDVDTLMFGSGLTFRNWSAEVTKTHAPTHVNVYEASKTKAGSGLDREGMILVALMSGGDYIPEGIPGIGPKVACEAARAGFGHDLCKISRDDEVSFRNWRERLQHELRTNESKHFKQKHKKLDIPSDFPNLEALGYYTRPAISSLAQIDRLRGQIQWDKGIDYMELREFTAEAFDWTKLGGATKFLRTLAPAVLMKALRLRANDPANTRYSEEKLYEESCLISAIHSKRNHPINDGMTEVRVSFRPLNIVPIDLGKEEPDDETPENGSEDEGIHMLDEEGIPAGASTTPSKRRAPPNYDPSQTERIWVAETLIKVGMPLKIQEWEDSVRRVQQTLEAKRAALDAVKAKSPRKKKAPNGGMPKGSLDRYAKAMKPGTSSFLASFRSSLAEKSFLQERQESPLPPSASQPAFRRPQATSSFTLFETARDSEVVTLLSSSPLQEITLKDTLPPFHPGAAVLPALPNTVTKRRRSRLRRAKTDSAALDAMRVQDRPITPSRPAPDLSIFDSSPVPSPLDVWPSKRSRLDEFETMDLTGRTPSKLTPRRSKSTHLSPAIQEDITKLFSPSKNSQQTTQQSSFQYYASHGGSINIRTTESKRAIFEDSRHIQSSKLPTQDKENEVIRERSRNASTLPSQPVFKMPPRRGPTAAEAGTKSVNHGEPAADVSVRRSPRLRRAMSDYTEPQEKLKSKEEIRIRESLPGTFAVEEVDLTVSTTRIMTKNKDGRTYRVSDISVVDLSTGMP